MKALLVVLTLVGITFTKITHAETPLLEEDFQSITLGLGVSRAINGFGDNQFTQSLTYSRSLYGSFGVEFGLQNYGSFIEGSGVGRVSFDSNLGVSLSAFYQHQLTSTLFAKLSVGTQRTDIDITVGDRAIADGRYIRDNQTGYNMLVNAGVHYHFSDNWTIGARYSRANADLGEPIRTAFLDIQHVF